MAILQNSINANSSTPLTTTQGGTGVSAPTAHGILVAQGSSAFSPKTLTNGQLLIGSTGADPVSASLASADTTLTITPSAGGIDLSIGTVAVAHGGTGKTSVTAHTLLVGNGTSALVEKTLTDGQVLIGSTGADPVPATLTAGSGISVTNASGTITIASTGSNPWVDQTTTSVTMTGNTSYSANNAALVTLTLPAVAAFGDEFEVVASAAGGFTIAQNASQSIRMGNVVTSTGTGGSISSTGQGDSVKLVCITANTGFIVINSEGTLNLI